MQQKRKTIQLAIVVLPSYEKNDAESPDYPQAFMKLAVLLRNDNNFSGFHREFLRPNVVLLLPYGT